MPQPSVFTVDAACFATPTLQQARTPGWQGLRSALTKELQPGARWAVPRLGLCVTGPDVTCDVFDCVAVRSWRGIVPAIFEVVEPRKLVKLSGLPFLSYHFVKLL